MNKKITRNNNGITLIAFAIIIFIILAVAFTTIYFIFREDSGEEVGVFQNNANWTTEQQIEKIKEKGMDTRIVSNMTTDEVPIPDGFSYVQGTKKTGIIIKSNEYEIEYLFIPYNDTISDDVNEYYEKVDYVSMDLMTLNSIKKYSGFFVELNTNFQMKDLKTINESNYEFLYEQLQYTIVDADTVNSHILYKEEIDQINNFIDSNNIDLGGRTIGIQGFVIEPFSKVNPEELVSENENINTSSVINIDKSGITKVSNLNIKEVASTKNTSDDEYVYMYKTSSEIYGGSSNKKVGIPIPHGFNYAEVDGIIMIQDVDNKDLIYIWVPIDESYDDQNKLRKKVWTDICAKAETTDGKKIGEGTVLYKELNNNKHTDEYWIREDKIKEENLELLESVKEFNGFYMSQAELSEKEEINSKKYMNTARGMVGYTASKTVNGGDWIRASQLKKRKYGNNSGGPTGTSGTVKYNIKKCFRNIADELNTHSSVVSHLTYGIEYDMALLWIAKTNSEFKDKDGNNIYNTLCINSTNVGKYSNSELRQTMNASEFTSFNGIWGLGGNLSEYTIEVSSDGHAMERGGSYNTTGEAQPIVSRNAMDLDKANQTNPFLREDLGMRTCLYISPNAEKKLTLEDTFKYNPKDDTIIEIDNIEFELWNETPRYINNWDGISVYEKPSESSNVIKKLYMAEKVLVTAKATSTITKTDGTELTWVRIDLDNNKVGYINANNLTDKITYFGDSIGFVMTGEQVARYYEEGFTVYSYPNDENILFSTVYSGQIEIIGKSVDQKWALYKVGEENRFVHANSLSTSIEKETAENGVELIKGKQKKFWTKEKNLAMYSEPQENNTIKTLNYGTEVELTAMSTNGIWSKVTIDSVQGFVLTDKLTPIEPSEEQKAEKGGTFTPTNDVVYVTASSLNVRTSCDSERDDNIVKSISYRDKVERIAKGDNGWDKVSIDDKVYFVYNKYLSKTQPKAVNNTAKSKVEDYSNWVPQCSYLTVEIETINGPTMLGKYKIKISVKVNKSKNGNVKSITYKKPSDVSLMGNKIGVWHTIYEGGEYEEVSASYTTFDKGKHTIKVTFDEGRSLEGTITVPYL